MVEEIADRQRQLLVQIRDRIDTTRRPATVQYPYPSDVVVLIDHGYLLALDSGDVVLTEAGINLIDG